MAAIGNIAIVDGEPTPVTHTFIPVSSAGDPFYRESIAGLALIGQPTITLSLKQDRGTGLNKLRVVMALPALEVVTGNNAAGYSAAPKVGYVNKVNIDMILPSRGTAQQRKDLRLLVSNLLLNSQVIDAIENLNIPY